MAERQEISTAALRLFRKSITYISPSFPSSSAASADLNVGTTSAATNSPIDSLPRLLRRSSTTSTKSSCSSSSERSVELQPWRYDESDREHDAVRRKRRELARERERRSREAWTQFWG